MSVNRKCDLCGIDRGRLISINTTRGVSVGLFCPLCAKAINTARHENAAIKFSAEVDC